MSDNELQVVSIQVERLYKEYRDGKFLINRRYQRKLVWSIEEKKELVDSVLKKYPIPLVLLTEVDYNGNAVSEVVDGMQRLNSLFSFIEQEFDVDGEYFNLESTATTKDLLDSGAIIQKRPIQKRSRSVDFITYNLPITKTKEIDASTTDDIFRRINANGRHLSKQEIRSAGIDSRFSNLVRDIACRIRGDVSSSSILLLNNMKEISLNSKALEYGINCDDLFWVKAGVLTKEKIRESKDEEIIADLIAYIVLPETIRSSSEILDDLYDNTDGGYTDIEAQLATLDLDKVRNDFLATHDLIVELLSLGESQLHKLMLGSDTRQMVPKYFVTLFCAIYELLIEGKMRAANKQKIHNALKMIGLKMSIQAGGKWSAQNRDNNVKIIKKKIRRHFEVVAGETEFSTAPITTVQNIITQKYTEQPIYEFKTGISKLSSSPAWDDQCFESILETFTAIANNLSNSVGYLCIGIADRRETADRLKKLTNIDSLEFRNYWICGIEGDAKLLGLSPDAYIQKITSKLSGSGLKADFVTSLLNELRIHNYSGKPVLVFKIQPATQELLPYKGKFFIRQGSSTHELTGVDISSYTSKFIRSKSRIRQIA